MKYIDLINNLETLIIFSVEELKLLDDKYNKSKVNDWLKKWYIKKIKQWYYILNKIDINEDILFLIANKSYSPSYISLETAFSYYNLIPEIVYGITSITTKKTVEFNFKNSSFNYRKINNTLFFWYKRVKFWNNIFLIAEIEKALLDYLYLNKNINSIEDFEWLRLNKIELKNKVDFKKLKKYTDIFDKKFLNKKIDLLIKYIKW